MTQYLFYCGKVGRLRDIDAREWSAEDFEAERRDLIAARRKRYPRTGEAYADTLPLYPENCTRNGVWFYDELVSSQGAAFTLFQLPDTTDEAIAQAREEIRRDRDAVSIRVLKIKELI